MQRTNEADFRAGSNVDRPSIAAGGPSRPTLEAADVELGLRYLTDFSVVVLAEPAGQETITVVADASLWGGARLVLVVGHGEAAPADLPSGAVVFESPASDPEDAFAN